MYESPSRFSSVCWGGGGEGHLDASTLAHPRVHTHPDCNTPHTLSLQYSQVPLWILNATEGILIAAITQRN